MLVPLRAAADHVQDEDEEEDDGAHGDGYVEWGKVTRKALSVVWVLKRLSLGETRSKKAVPRHLNTASIQKLPVKYCTLSR